MNVNNLTDTRHVVTMYHYNLWLLCPKSVFFFLYKNEEITNYSKFIILIPNFLSHFVSKNMPEGNNKSNIWIFITRNVNYRLYDLADSPKNLVTFQFRCIHFWRHLRGKRKGKTLDYDNKNNSYTLYSIPDILISKNLSTWIDTQYQVNNSLEKCRAHKNKQYSDQSIDLSIFRQIHNTCLSSFLHVKLFFYLIPIFDGCPTW